MGERLNPKHVIVLDNGGHTIKIGFASDEEPILVMPNCIGRARKGSKSKYVGESVRDLTDYTIFRPSRRGIVLDYEMQKDIWSVAFTEIGIKDFSKYHILITEPECCPQQVTEQDGPSLLYSVIFEDFGFASCCVQSSARCAAFDPSIKANWDAKGKDLSPCVMIVDCGFSGCTAVPIFKGDALDEFAQRLNVGGRVLTNYLKEVLAYNAFDLQFSPLLLDDIKEKCCEIAVKYDLLMAKAALYQRQNVAGLVPENWQSHYKLPNFVDTCVGDSVDDEASAIAESENAQVIHLGSEKIAVPELLFRPQDCGIRQAGVAEMTARVIKNCPPALQPMFIENIVVVGAGARFGGFFDRFERELISNLPSELGECNIVEMDHDDLLQSVWRGARELARSPKELKVGFLSREEFNMMNTINKRERRYL